MRTLVVIPTFNEALDVERMVNEVLDSSLEPDVIVVDDSSPDGTSEVVASVIAASARWTPRVRLITRDGKGGRGGAVREGMRRGLEDDEHYELFVEMDCDFSHNPEDLVVGAAVFDGGWDVVIGSRYPDGTIIGWPWTRRVFSRFANTTARLLIDRSVSDYTNGFRFYSRSATDAILTEPQRHTGFIYLSESLAVCLARGFTVTSFPIEFRNRERGTSNTDFREIKSAASGIIDVARWYRSARSQ